MVISDADREGLIVLNRLPELLLLKDKTPTVRVVAATRPRTRLASPPEVLQSDIIQRMRKDRTRQEQKEEKWVTDHKTCLSGDLTKLSTGEARTCSEIADEFKADENGLARARREATSIAIKCRS
ncbi:hypothetical protein PInf_015076 [Phytophthora infestans]|nr:hypothetical protein PInf_015076 [Phytophthora infestans]